MCMYLCNEECKSHVMIITQQQKLVVPHPPGPMVETLHFHFAYPESKYVSEQCRRSYVKYLDIIIN